MDRGVADFTSWYEHEAPGITRALGLVLGDHLLAEEATAEAFAKAFACWDRVRVMTSPAGWVVRVARNEAHGRFRRRRLEARVANRRTRAADVPPPPEPHDALWGRLQLTP